MEGGGSGSIREEQTKGKDSSLFVFSQKLELVSGPLSVMYKSDRISKTPRKSKAEAVRVC